MIALLVVPTHVLLLAMPTSLTLQRRSWAVCRLNCISHQRTAVYPVTRLRHCCVLFSCWPKQRSDLHQTSSSLRLGRPNRLCYTGCGCKILYRSAVYLWFRWEQLSLPSTRLRDLPPSTFVECILKVLQSSALSQSGQARNLQGPILGGLSDDGRVERLHVEAVELLPLLRREGLSLI